MQTRYAIRLFGTARIRALPVVAAQRTAVPASCLTRQFHAHATFDSLKPSRVILQASKFTMASAATVASPLLLRQPVVACQGSSNRRELAVVDDVTKKPSSSSSSSIIHTGEISFGVLLGACTGYFIKKVGRLFAMMLGAAFIFLQYMSAKGFITIHWDRMQADYNKEFDIDKDGKVTVRDVRSRWQTVINLLTKNIQFKSTFLAGLYAGIRLG